MRRPSEPLATSLIGGARPWPKARQTKEPEQEPAAKAPKEDGEFVFGSKVLPRAGIVIVLLAMLYLVALGIQDGWITPQTQFIGELLLCGALIGVGVWKLNEREDFGQVLVGGGSCGLYFSLAGAYAYKDLITSEALVALFALLSLVILGFSWWRSSKTFWMIGYVGGLVAAAMPMDEQNHAAALVLTATIVVTASVLAGYKLWFKALAGLWFVSSLFVIFVVMDAVVGNAMSLPAAIAVFYLIAIVPIVAHALRFVPNKFDDKAWFLLIAGGLTSVATLTLTLDFEILPVPHSVGILLWSVALLVLGGAVRGRPQSQTLLLTAVGTATVFAPMGFTAFAASMTYAALGLAVSAVSRLRREGIGQAGPILSACYVALTIVAYAIAMGSSSVSTTGELVMLGAIAVGVANVAYVAGKLKSQMATAMTIGAVVFYLILSRATYVSGGDEPVYVMLFSQAVYAAVLGVIALRAKWPGLSATAMTITALGMLIHFAYSGEQGPFEPGPTIGLYAVMTISLVLSALGAGRDEGEQRWGSLVAAAVGCFVVVPMFSETLGLPAIGLGYGAAMVAALTVYAVALALISLRTKWPGQAYIGATVTAVAIVFYWFEVAIAREPVGTSLQLALTLAMCVSIAACAFGAGGEDVRRQVAWVVASILGWFALARTLYLVLVLPSIGMADQAALTTSWSLYSAIVLTAGFRFDMKYIRITSLVMFGVTIAKVFLVDLAELEDLVKVLVLLVLGLVILGGGYLYVRARNARADAS